MAVIADTDVFAVHGHHAFDVILALLVGPHLFDAAGLKNNYLTALRPAEIVSQPIDEQVVTTEDFQLHNVVAAMKCSGDDSAVRILQSGALQKFVRGEPDFVPLVTGLEILVEIEKQETLRRLDFTHLAVTGRNHMFVLEPFVPKEKKAADRIRNLDVRTVPQIFMSDAVQGWLHGTGRNFEWLKKECPDAH